LLKFGTKSVGSYPTIVTPLDVVTTRLFEAPDLRALYAIEEACFEPSVRFSRALMRTLAHDLDCRVWLGIVDEVRVGFAIVGLRGDEDPAAAYIWTIEVLPAFRRRGVARQLLMRVEESARQATCSAIELHVSERNANAMALYAAAGYAQFGVEAGFYGRNENGLRYRKMLAAGDATK
jgi:ribosomal protein S18 acetylase RimI-like enzyme